MKTVIPPNIVTIGGGTGQSNVILALKEVVKKISAIVTMADDGGSTGRLRKYQNAPAVGDIRKALVALAPTNNFLARLFPYRYGDDRWGMKAVDIEGHVLGNLILVALIDQEGSLKAAIDRTAHELGIVSHQVLPSTYDNVILAAELKNHQKVFGQFKISHLVGRVEKFRIKKVWLETQPRARAIVANSEAVEAVKRSDAIIIGPGALHGSLLPNLLIKDITRAIIDSQALTIYIANLAIKLAETTGFSLKDHVQSIIQHTDPKLIDLILVNQRVPAEVTRGIEFLQTDLEKIAGIPVIQADLIDEDDPFAHDPGKLKKALLEVFNS